ncbi:MAG: acetyl-CoA carboxylase biotin carboxyl carrier protein [Gemmatimonadota bacterium]|nr:acetyl-CoA carboxylase biotin carboxyl carrier protein [Gemmatimonadota bacterium]MDH3424960.1 acetyl-CoA carboxylase biotin carboxyl carrier protein [Gemmatimonadota bacterium]
MIDLDMIERLIRVVDKSGLDSLEIERGGTRVKLSKTAPVGVAPVGFAPSSVAPPPASAPAASAEAGSPVAAAKVPPASSHLLDITAPMVGTFYLSPAPDAPAYVEPGTKVKPGDTLCIIEAMKLMNELECEVSGTIREICVDNAQPVEFGQVLFRVDPG